MLVPYYGVHLAGRHKCVKTAVNAVEFVKQQKLHPVRRGTVVADVRQGCWVALTNPLPVWAVVTGQFICHKHDTTT